MNFILARLRNRTSRQYSLPKFVRKHIYLLSIGCSITFICSIDHFLGIAEVSAASIVTEFMPSKIIVESKHILRQVEPTFWGFSLDLSTFQSDFLDKNKHVRLDLLKMLQAFPNAVYRYPSGTPSNYFDWTASVGPIEKRFPQKIVPWREPQPIVFGFDEYMTFVRNVGGVPWVTLNIFGAYDQELPIKQLSATSKQWVEYASMNYPHNPIFRWELGNELFMKPYNWSPQKYTERSRKTIEVINSKINSDSYVAVLEDYKKKPDFPKLSISEYNSLVSKNLGLIVSNFALHHYYGTLDAVQESLGYINQAIVNIKNNIPNGIIGLWITETKVLTVVKTEK